MSNLHDDNHNNLVSFLRQNKPPAPNACGDLEQQIFDSLEPRTYNKKLYLKWTIPGAIATGFLFTSISLGFRTPRLASEPKDLENFLIKNWQSTLDSQSYNTVEETEAYWLLLTTPPSKPALSSAQ